MKTRHVVIGCTLDPMTYTMILPDGKMTLDYARLAYEGGSVKIALVEGKVHCIDVCIDKLDEYQYLYDVEIEFTGDLMNYVKNSTTSQKDKLTILNRVEDKWFQCIDTEGNQYTISSSEIINHDITNAKVYLEQDNIIIESIGTDIPVYTEEQFKQVSAYKETQDQLQVDMKVFYESTRHDSVDEYDIDWNTMTLCSFLLRKGLRFLSPTIRYYQPVVVELGSQDIIVPLLH